MSDAAYSLMFLNAIAGLATRLSVDGLAVYSVRYDYPTFGSWELVAGRRLSRVRMVWDGKAAQLQAYAAQLDSAADLPRWQPMSEKDFSKRRGEHAEIFAAAYAAIRQHAAA
jgi:hypothetical protein